MLISIDPASSSLGYALFLEGLLVEAGSVKSSFTPPYKRRFDIINELHIKTYTYSPSVLVCEEPKLGGRFQTASQTAMDKLLGQIEYYFLNDREVEEIFYYHPMTLKAQIGGSGKSSKLEVALGAGEILRSDKEKEIVAKLIEAEDFDATDAIAAGLTHLIQEGYYD